MSTQGKVEIRKVDLVDGEELQGLIKRVIDAITRSKGKTKRSVGLAGIYKDHIITRDFETGRFFKMKMERDGSNIKLSEPEEVRQVFVAAKVTKAAQTGTTGETNGHAHEASWDDETGAGSTSTVEGHKHGIIGGKVSETDGHTHAMPAAGSKGDDKKGEKEKAKKSLVAIDGDVHEVQLSADEVVAVIKSLSGEPSEYAEPMKESLWAGVLS